jgi:membrane protease YdiL (CAAX protease family)
VTDLLTLAALVAVLAYFVLANVGEVDRRGGAGERPHPRYRVARLMTLVVGAVIAGVAALFGLVLLLEAAFGASAGRNGASGARGALIVGLPLLAAGSLGLLYLWPPVQRAVARVMPLRPRSPVGYASVVLALTFTGLQLGTQLSEDVLSAIASGPPLTNTDVLAQDVPLLVLGFVGVGIFVRRSTRETLQRLGLIPPGVHWWAIALVGVLAFLLVGAGIEKAASALTPGTQEQVNRVSNALFKRFDNPGAVVFLAVVAGVAEEIVFRGALQPRFGLIATAFLFAAVHTQYGITFASLEVFVLGLGLGWLRAASKSTLPGIVTHAGYDLIVGLIGLVH